MPYTWRRTGHSVLTAVICLGLCTFTTDANEKTLKPEKAAMIEGDWLCEASFPDRKKFPARWCLRERLRRQGSILRPLH